MTPRALAVAGLVFGFSACSTSVPVPRDAYVPQPDASGALVGAALLCNPDGIAGCSIGALVCEGPDGSCRRSGVVCDLENLPRCIDGVPKCYVPRVAMARCAD